MNINVMDVAKGMGLDKRIGTNFLGAGFNTEELKRLGFIYTGVSHF